MALGVSTGKIVSTREGLGVEANGSRGAHRGGGGLGCLYMESIWAAVDAYVADRLIPADASLDAVLRASETAGLPPIQVSQAQGKFLHLLAKLMGAKSILEIGTLGGYSTIWMARALPAGGTIVTLELDPAHAAVAQANFARAGVAEKVDLRLGAAIHALPRLVSEGAGPFDLIFVDADKESAAEYLEGSLKLARPGTLIIVDNVVRGGEVANLSSTDARVQGIQRFMDRVRAHPELAATALQTVGAKGYDGFALVLVP